MLHLHNINGSTYHTPQQTLPLIQTPTTSLPYKVKRQYAQIVNKIDTS